MDVEIVVKYKVKNVCDEDDLNNYFGEGESATLRQFIDDIISVRGLCDFVNNAEVTICDVKIECVQ